MVIICCSIYHHSLVLLVDVVDQVERLFLYVELDRLGEVFEHELAGLDHMFRLRVIVALLTHIQLISQTVLVSLMRDLY